MGYESIDKQRRNLPFSFQHTVSFLSQSAESTELVDLLKELGDSPALRLRFLALSWGLAPFFEWRYTTELKLKDIVKGWLSKLQGASKNKTAEAK
jgi:hypothetical protein